MAALARGLLVGDDQRSVGAERWARPVASIMVEAGRSKWTMVRPGSRLRSQSSFSIGDYCSVRRKFRSTAVAECVIAPTEM